LLSAVVVYYVVRVIIFLRFLSFHAKKNRRKVMSLEACGNWTGQFYD